MPPAIDVPPALAAFLRGSERRAWVFLWLQGGDAEAADQALAAASRAFRADAAGLPLAEWPERYWRLLAASPLEVDHGRWPGDLDLLAVAAPVDRRALLLRLAAGLDEQPAADALGVSLDTYRQRLAAACPRDPAGQVDVAAWHGLAQAIQQAARELPDSRLERIAGLRDTALSGHGIPAPATTAADTGSPAAHADGRPAARKGPRPGQVAMLLLAVLAAAAGIGVYLQRSGPVLPPVDEATSGVDDLRVHDPGPILVEPLPDPEPPAVPAAPVPPALEEPPADPAVAQMDLLSWYAAGAPDSRIEREEGAPAPGPVAGGGDDGELSAARAWAQLDAAAQAGLREAALRFASLPAAEQASLRHRFAALDRMERRGWRFGPDLGNDWPGLQPWLGFVPEDERDPLLRILRAMDSTQRAQLAELLRRQSPAGRIELRRELLAIPPARRAGWLEEASRR